eukprot:7460041-Lingulodinium_polyedra.AAC.1
MGAQQQEHQCQAGDRRVQLPGVCGRAPSLHLLAAQAVLRPQAEAEVQCRSDPRGAHEHVFWRQAWR